MKIELNLHTRREREKSVKINVIEIKQWIWMANGQYIRKKKKKKRYARVSIVALFQLYSNLLLMI